VNCEQASKAGSASGSTKASFTSAADDNWRGWWWQESVHDVYQWNGSSHVSSLWSPSRVFAVQLTHETVLQLPWTHSGEDPNRHT